MAEQTYEEFEREQNKLASSQARKTISSNVLKGVSRVQDSSGKLLSAGKPTNIGTLQRQPQTILSKEQRMLGALFNSKNQFWGNGEPVQINNTLTSGNGLLNTGSGDRTRRLFLP